MAPPPFQGGVADFAPPTPVANPAPVVRKIPMPQALVDEPSEVCDLIRALLVVLVSLPKHPPKHRHHLPFCSFVAPDAPFFRFLVYNDATSARLCLHSKCSSHVLPKSPLQVPLEPNHRSAINAYTFTCAHIHTSTHMKIYIHTHMHTHTQHILHQVVMATVLYTSAQNAWKVYLAATPHMMMIVMLNDDDDDDDDDDAMVLRCSSTTPPNVLS